MLFITWYLFKIDGAYIQSSENERQLNYHDLYLHTYIHTQIHQYIQTCIHVYIHNHINRPNKLTIHAIMQG